jgi:hypothetical protein
MQSERTAMNGKVSNLELAEFFGISRQAISMLVARGVINKDADGLLPRTTNV